jgi:hypothetical protein
VNLACTLCRRRLPTSPHVCEPCRASLTRTLATIPSLHADALTRAATSTSADSDPGANDPVSQAFPAGPVRPTVYSSRTTGGSVESAAPIDLDLVTVVASNPLAPLDQWVTTWWHDGDQHADTITWLTRHLDRACDERTDIPAFATDLNAVARQLRAAAQDGRQLLGHCPTEDCDRPLYAELRDQDVTCPGCSTTWPRRHWLWLADTLRTAA